MFFKELFQQLEIDLLVARSGGLTSRKVGGWRNDREDALVFVGEFRDELDEWPEEYPGSYEEFIYGLGAIRLDDIEGSTLSPEWKENAKEGIVYYLLARMSEIHTHYILPPAVLLNRLGSRTGGAIWELCGALNSIKPEEARDFTRKWLEEIKSNSGFTGQVDHGLWHP